MGLDLFVEVIYAYQFDRIMSKNVFLINQTVSAVPKTKTLKRNKVNDFFPKHIYE